MKRIIAMALTLGLMASAPVAWSHEEPAAEEEEKSPWSGKVGLGYSKVSGNTETESFSFSTEVNYDGVKRDHQFIGRAISQSDNDATTAEAYKASWESKFKFTERNYAFGLLDYNKNRFSSYDQQIFEILGVGRKFIDAEKHAFDAQLGIGASQSDLADGTEQNEFTSRFDADYIWSFTDSASFQQKLSVSHSSNNTFTQSLTELRTAIIGALNLVLSYAIQNNSDVLPGTEKTDTFTTISIEYAF